MTFHLPLPISGRYSTSPWITWGFIPFSEYCSAHLPCVPNSRLHKMSLSVNNFNYQSLCVYVCACELLCYISSYAYPFQPVEKRPFPMSRSHLMIKDVWPIAVSWGPIFTVTRWGWQCLILLVVLTLYSACLHPNWHPLPYKVHYFWLELFGPW